MSELTKQTLSDALEFAPDLDVRSSFETTYIPNEGYAYTPCLALHGTPGDLVVFVQEVASRLPDHDWRQVQLATDDDWVYRWPDIHMVK